MPLHKTFILGKTTLINVHASEIRVAVGRVVTGVATALNNFNGNTIAGKNRWFNGVPLNDATVMRNLQNMNDVFSKWSKIMIAEATKDVTPNLYGRMYHSSLIDDTSRVGVIYLAPKAFLPLDDNAANRTCRLRLTKDAALVKTIAHELAHLICRVNIVPPQNESYEQHALGLLPANSINNADNYAYLIEFCCLG